MKTKRVIKIIFISLICIIIILLVYGPKILDKYSVSPDKYIDRDTISMKSSQIIGLDSSIKTPTGVTYDEVAGTFWLCDYGNEDKQCSIYELSKDFRLTGREIELTSILDVDWNLQGITYDSQEDSFWIAVGNKVVEVDKEGNELSEIVLAQFGKFKSNGIAYDCKQPLSEDSRAAFPGQSRPYQADSLGYQQGRGYSAPLISIDRCSRRKLCFLNKYSKSCR